MGAGSAESRVVQWACECRYIQRTHMCSGSVSAAMDREKSRAVDRGGQEHAESRVGEWTCECSYMQRDEMGSGLVSACTSSEQNWAVEL